MKACIFDLDGTLLDSMGVWEQIDEEFLRSRGFDVPKDYGQAICHLRAREVAEYTINRFGLDESPEAVLAQWQEMAFEAYRTSIPLKPGAREYLEALRQRGIRLAVATSLAVPLRDAALRHHRLEALFDVVCGTDEVARDKQFPDIYLYTAEKLGIPPENCAVFEDILPAVRSAKEAGMTVYAIYDFASKSQWEEMCRTADGALYDFYAAPLPEKEDLPCHLPRA